MNKKGKLAVILAAMLLLLCSCGNDEGIDQPKIHVTRDSNNVYHAEVIEMMDLEDIKDADSLKKYAESHSEFYEYLWENFTVLNRADQTDEVPDLETERDPADIAPADGSQSAEAAPEVSATPADSSTPVKDGETITNKEEKEAPFAVLQANDVYFDKTEGKNALSSYLESKSGSEWMNKQSLSWAKDQWSGETVQSFFQDCLDSDDGRHFLKELKKEYTKPFIIGSSVFAMICLAVIGILVKLLVDCRKALKEKKKANPKNPSANSSSNSSLRNDLDQTAPNPTNSIDLSHPIPLPKDLEETPNPKSSNNIRDERRPSPNSRKPAPSQNGPKQLQGGPSPTSEAVAYWTVSQASKEGKQNHIEYYTLKLEPKAPLRENIQTCPYCSNGDKLQLNFKFCQEQGLMLADNSSTWSFLMGSSVQINEVFNLYDQNGNPITKAHQAKGMRPINIKEAVFNQSTGTIVQKGEIILKKGGPQR